MSEDTTVNHSEQPEERLGGNPPAALPPPQIRLTFGGSEVQVIDAASLDQQSMEEIVKAMQAADGEVQIEIVNLLAFPDQARFFTLSAIQEAGARVQIKVGDAVFSDPFKAVLASINVDDVGALRNSRRAAIEAAAIFYADLPEEAAKMLNARLKELGAATINKAAIVGDIKRLVSQGVVAEPCDAGTMAAAFLAAARTEAGIGQDLLPYRHYRNSFFMWMGTYWSEIPDGLMNNRVVAWLGKHGATDCGTNYVQAVLLHLRGRISIDDWIRNMPFYSAPPDQADQVDDFANGQDQPATVDHRYVVFSNGMIALNELLACGTPTVLPHDPNWFSLNALDFAFDHTAACPLWLKFLSEVLPCTTAGDRRIAVLRAFFGYCLLTDCRFEIMLILFGLGSNGKSVVIRLLARLLGERNVSAVAYDQLTNEFRLSSLIGKLVNLSSEMNHLSKANEAQLRAIISGESMTINRKYKDPINAKLFAKLLAAANELPTFADGTNATWRRLLIIPFDVTISPDEANRRLVDELATELPGIFNWAVAGLRELLAANRFPVCDRCAAVLAKHRSDSDTVREFLAECLVAADDQQLYSQTTYELYSEFCSARGRKAVADNVFGRRLGDLGLKKVRARTQGDGSRPWVYDGWRIRSDATWVVDRTFNKYREGSKRPRLYAGRPAMEGPSLSGLSGLSSGTQTP